MTTPFQAETKSPTFDSVTSALLNAIDEHRPPQPQTFDFIPPLHDILARLLLPSPSLILAPADGAVSVKNDTVSNSDHLDIQQLGSAAAGVRVRMQKARQAIAALPDVNRTVEEQQEEISHLEQRVAAMKDMLASIGSHR